MHEHPHPDPRDADASRRRVLRLGLAGGLSALGAAWLPGCVGVAPAVYDTGGSSAATPIRYGDAPAQRPRPVRTPAPPPTPPTPAPAFPGPAVRVTPRSAWTRGGLGGDVKPMNGVRRITVHHSALVTRATSARSTAATLVAIREGHLARGWADIGYHFAVDPAGRVIACRDLRHQGAHVADHNEHNVGVCVLGNFDEQRPTAAQLKGLHAALTGLAGRFRVPMRRVFTHREFNPTACPGESLQRHMVLARRGLA